MTFPTDPADLGAGQAARLIARGALSATELARACIARTEAVNPAINALVAHDFDRVLEEAAEADQRLASGAAVGPLHGVPFAVKDMIDVADLPTTFGSEIFRHNIATVDDALVRAMRNAGAIPLGKTNNPEWSAGGNTRNAVYGATANPHDLTKSCAGSSGGSAAALAAGMAPLATGSDMGGSLRNPAAFCGVVGFRPSPGLVPGHKRAVALIPLSTDGPMARTVADCGLMLSVIARPDRRDPMTHVNAQGLSPQNPAVFTCLPRRRLTGLRFAVTEDFGFAPTEAAIRTTFRTVIRHLPPHLILKDAHPDCADADRIFSVLRSLMFVATHGEMLARHPGLVGPNVRANVEEGRGYTALDVAEAMILHGHYYRRWQAFFETADFILSPAVTVSPRDWRELYPARIDGVATKSYYHWLALAYAATLAGHPSITIPAGRDVNGLPFGLQIIGRRNDDLGVLAVAQEFEALFAADDRLCAPRVDIARLAASPPLHRAEGFMGF